MKNILITGCSSGFGRLTAEALAREGHFVFASMKDIKGKNLLKADDLSKWAKENFAPMEVIELDVTNETSISKAVETIIYEVGEIDIVINNAGITSIGVLESLSLNQIESIFNVNTLGALRVNQAILPHMRQRRSGLLIHISSTLGSLCMPFTGAYTGSKVALEAIAWTYNFELAEFGIDSVVIEPGINLTENMKNTVIPSDINTNIRADYSNMLRLQEKVFSKMKKDITCLNAPDPEEVVEAIKKTISLPQGKRPFRTVAGSIGVEGVDQYNNMVEEYQERFLKSLLDV